MAAIYPVFENFPCWSGLVRNGFDANFLGMVTDQRFFSSSPAPVAEGEYFAQTDYPLAAESCYDLIAVLEAVMEARDCFIIIELGAGYGCWAVTGSLAAKSQGLKCRLIAVEPELGHFRMLKMQVWRGIK